MDVQMRVLLRLFQWFRRPPSRQHLWIIGATVAVAVVIALVEWGFGWPDALTVDRGPRVIRQ
ncbi:MULTISPECIES: hypothetical protein [Roseococcus]|uniref:Uncharacterized protein n=1 Tax=Roseococcus suduntuyensis TaxID=455361 RepID=A0A840A990_9PROT|nr:MULTISPECIES: hypothetical protein [Roseococcus]MBB3897771.1 hypothetical protein [Roseococcus suduntuyensis]